MSNNRFFNPFFDMGNMACDLNCYRDMAQKNWQAMNAAAQVMTDNMQAIARRQADELNQQHKQNIDCMQRQAHCNDPKEMHQSCHQHMMQAAQDAAQYVRDMAQLAVKATNDALDIFQQRLNEANEQQACKNHNKPAAACSKK